VSPVQVIHAVKLLTANIGLGWKSLAGTNTITYFDAASVRRKKRFIKLTSVCRVLKIKYMFLFD
jgi:hypothetical protein